MPRGIKIILGKVNCLIHFPIAICSTDNREGVHFSHASNVNVQIATFHVLHTNCVYAHPSKCIPSEKRTHRGKSCGAGVQIKTNADESSLCAPHQYSPTGAALLKLQYGLLSLASSCVRFSEQDCGVSYPFVTFFFFFLYICQEWTVEEIAAVHETAEG